MRDGGSQPVHEESDEDREPRDGVDELGESHPGDVDRRLHRRGDDDILELEVVPVVGHVRLQAGARPRPS